ncbi:MULTISPECIES: hypothetical protein [unclassified Acinetobacter]|uniref:hypothetical protein n=1 Tax=unclassified Acinetobacter TaxID=196816 RepID=UPI0015D3A2D5|nr:MULTISPECIES: hypothetical protein [unclassified Acinetobacter]
MSDKLGPNTETVPGNAKAWEGYPDKTESCSVRQPFCLLEFNRKIVQPYNFMMPAHMWEHVANTNKLEYALAIRFGLEHDVLANENLINTTGYHTRMYVLFQKYLKKNVVKEAALVVAEFKSNEFKTRFGTTFAIQDLIGLKGTLDDLNISDVMVGAAKLQMKNGGEKINRTMYKLLFNQDYNPKMLKVLAEQGIYPDA